jgi:acetyl esterase/lipase
MMKVIALLLLCVAQLSYAQDTVYLRNDKMRPFLVIFHPEHVRQTRSAVIVCSGGSYGGLANIKEGIPAAKELAASGITAFLLNYRLPQGNNTLPLSDLQLALHYVNQHANAYDLKKDKIGIMGFSAGGHLVSGIGTHWKNSYDSVAAPLRPAFMVLVYPVISFADSLTHRQSRSNFLGKDTTAKRVEEFSNELQVSGDTPPTFITTAMDDKLVIAQNSLYFAAALRQHRIPVETFLYVKGGHGYGIHNSTAEVQWIEACIEWIKKEKWKN